MKYIILIIRAMFISLSIDIRKISAKNINSSNANHYELTLSKETRKKKKYQTTLDNFLKKEKRYRKNKINKKIFQTKSKDNRYSNQKAIRRMYRNS